MRAAMTRFPFIPFLASVAATSALTYCVWLSREESLTPAQPPRKAAGEISPAPATQPFSASGAAAFEEFRKHTESERDLKYIESLDATAMAAMASGTSLLDEEALENGAIDVFICRWMELDPNAVAEWVMALPSGPLKKNAASAAFTPWTEADPKAAAKWFRERTGHRPWEVLRDDGALKDKWGDIAEPFTEGDFRNVREIAADLAALPKEARERVRPGSAHMLLTSEWSAAVEAGGMWREGLDVLQDITTSPGHPLSDWADYEAGSLLREALVKDPALVMAWIAKNPRYGSSDARAAEVLSGLLNAESRAKAAKEHGTSNWPTTEQTVEWFLKLPRGIKEQSPLEVLIHCWAAYDQAAAGDFLNRQEPGQDTDNARWVMAMQVANIDPPSALEWAQSIADETLRAKSRKDVLNAWKRYDPVEGAAYEAGKQTPGEPEP